MAFFVEILLISWFDDKFLARQPFRRKWTLRNERTIQRTAKGIGWWQRSYIPSLDLKRKITSTVQSSRNLLSIGKVVSFTSFPLFFYTDLTSQTNEIMGNDVASSHMKTLKVERSPYTKILKETASQGLPIGSHDQWKNIRNYINIFTV